MNQSTNTTAVEEVHEQRSVLATLAIVIGVAMVAAIVLGIGGGIVHGWKGQVAMLILTSIPVCTLGTGLAVISLIWRKENKKLAQAALWLNGLVAFFGFPLMIYWVLVLA